MKKEPKKYKMLIVSHEKDISVEELRKEMLKLKGWTLDSVIKMTEPGIIGFILILKFVR